MTRALLPLGDAVNLSDVAALAVDAHRAAPCAVVAAARAHGDTFRFGLGAAGRLSFDPDAARADAATWFDLASLTKPVTALTLARLSRRGILRRHERLADALPELADTVSASASLDLLSAHRAGLDAHRTLYAPLIEGGKVDRISALRTAASARREGLTTPMPTEGFAPVYSDLGYLLIGAAIEMRVGEPFDAVAAREVLAPLGLADPSPLPERTGAFASRTAIGSAAQLAASDPAFFERVAPTETVPWRGGTVRGRVHDENAWALAGDHAAGHAGFFGSAPAVALLGVAILEALRGLRRDWLDTLDLEPLVRERPGGSLRAGFDSRTAENPSSGTLFGSRTFGHLGFTGTSLWIDPDAGFVGVLCTNRVHPTRATDAIRRARPAVYDALVLGMR